MNKFLLVVLLILPGLLIAQDNTDFDPLLFYSDVMVNAIEDQNRVYAELEFKKRFEEILLQANSFDKSFESLKAISVQYPEDKSFRVISWQLKRSEEDYTYSSYLQKSDGTLTKFKNTDKVNTLDFTSTYNASTWPTQLIYNIKECEVNGSKAYVLFGMTQPDKYNKVKTADVLTFEQGELKLGAPLFVKNNDGRELKRNRLIIEYGADSNASLNFNTSLSMIAHDHLISRRGMIPGQGVAMYPDGSYEGYEFKNGEWLYVEKIYNQIMSEAPRPNPVKKDNTNIFGKKKKTKKKQ